MIPADSFVLFLILFSTLGVAFHYTRHKPTYALNILLAGLAVCSIIHFTNYGKLHWVNKSEDPQYIEATGTKDKRLLFHWHEIYHYYLGAKYYPELGHYGLYEAVLLADNQSYNPKITISHMRDLSHATQAITIKEGLERADNKWRPRFSDERWIEFYNDVAYLKSISNPSWFNLGMFDAGFNAPPTWNVIGYPLANFIPITKAEEWVNYAPTWDQAEFLPLIDVLLILIGAGAIFWAFGYMGLILFVVIFGTSYISGVGWTMGSFLRHMWFFGLVMGICMLAKKKYTAAGCFLAFATCMRIFPAVFLFAAFLALAIQYAQQKKKDPKPLIQFFIGAASVGLGLLLISIIAFGFDAWKEFIENIGIHKDLYFVWHIGYKRIIVWEDWVPGQNFWWHEGLERFRGWNARLQSNWDLQKAFQIPLTLFILTAAGWAMRHMRPAEGTLLFGGLALFFYALPANYYYVYMCIIPAVLFERIKDWRSNAILASMFLMWWLLPFYDRYTNDDLTYNYWICSTIFVFFLVWLALRLAHKNSMLAKYISKNLEG
jgi:hypothetical protein